MVRRVNILILCASVYITAVAAQRRPIIPGDTLAEIGTRVITGRDLIERIELMPWQGKENPALHDSAKVRALQSLVAEQILALEASALGVGNDSLTMMNRRGVERLMVRDELYKREVKARIAVSDRELSQGMKKYASQLTLLAMGFRSEADARQISRALKTTKNIDSTLSAVPATILTRRDSLTVNLGSLEAEFEEVAYSLSLKSRVSPPVNSSTLGWAVFYLVSRETNPEYAKKSVPDRLHTVESALRRRKEEQRSSKYAASILNPQQAEGRPEMFESLAKAALDIFRSDSLRFKKKGVYPITTIVDTLFVRLWPHVGETYAEAEGGGIPLGDILEGFRTLQAAFPSLEDEDFRLRLNSAIKNVIAAELLAREGYRQNLHQTEAVQHDVAVWTDYWISRQLERKIVNSARANDEDVMTTLVEKGGILGRPYEVNIREILSDSLREALLNLEKLNDGADMADLARKVSKRTAWAVRGGESGFFHVSGYPELGFRALAADSGLIVGPVHVQNGYSIFSVLGKRQAPGDSIPTFDSLKALVRRAVQTDRGQKEINAFIASKAKNYQVRMHYNRLKNVSVTRSNMVTRRFIGFGGVITAVPMLNPQWKWIREVKEMNGILP